MFLAKLRQSVVCHVDGCVSEKTRKIAKNALFAIYLFSILSSSIVALAQDVDTTHAQNSKVDQTIESQNSTSQEKVVDDAILLQSRIVGGNVADENQWPSLVALVMPGQLPLRSRQFCGGSVVADRWVLTAAHCLFNQDGSATTPEQVRIVAGIDDLNDPDVDEIVVTNLYVHPQYDNSAFPVNDIGLIELATAVSVPQNALSDVNPETLVGREAFIAGWGALSEEGPLGIERFPNLLHEAALPIVSMEQCNLPESYNGKVQTTHLCAGLRQGGVDSCQGDSGGPLYVVEGTQQVQIGVTSFGAGCARPNLYGVYTNVDAYRVWMSNYFNLTAGAVTASGAVSVGGEKFAGATHPLFLTVLAGFTILLLIRVFESRRSRRLLVLTAALLATSACSSNLLVSNDSATNQITSVEARTKVSNADQPQGASFSALTLVGDESKAGVNELVLGATRSETIAALAASGFDSPTCDAQKTSIKGTGRLFLREDCEAMPVNPLTLNGLNVNSLAFQILDNRLIRLEFNLESGDAMALANQLNLQYDHMPSAQRPFEWRLKGDHIRIISADNSTDDVDGMLLQMIDGRLFDKLPKLFEYPQ